MTNKEILEALEEVQESSLRASDEGFQILEQLKDGSITLTEAAEKNKALGKTNRAISVRIKAINDKRVNKES